MALSLSSTTTSRAGGASDTQATVLASGSSPGLPQDKELHCPGCKVTISVPDAGRRRHICPYCGSFYDPELEVQSVAVHRRHSHHGLNDGRHARHRRSASPRLPSVRTNSNRRMSSGSVERGSSANRQGRSRANHADSGAINSLLVSSLGSLTLGSLGMGRLSADSERLPKVPADAKNKLVLVGSGNKNHRNHQGKTGKAYGTAGSGHDPSTNAHLSHLTHTERLAKVRESYNEKCLSGDEFKAMIEDAKATKNFDLLQDFYASTFRSAIGICSAFKQKSRQDGARLDNPELRQDFMYLVHDNIKALSVSIQKTVIRSVVHCLLDETTPLLSKDHPRTLFVLLQNPLFASQATYTILAHLLQQITRLPNADHQLLVHWFRTVPTERLRAIIQVMLQFITIRQFPPADKSLPPLNKSRWWIPTATKVLALVNAANNLKHPPLLDYTDFYNISLDHMDLMQEYYTWQNPERANQYPFILSIVAKQHILTKDSEQQMILTARRSLVQKMARHQQPQIEIFFLNITVRRDHLVEDSLKEISAKQKDLKKKLKISFVGEPGLDMGGLTKEWFQLLIRKIFDPDYGMFVYHRNSRCYWFSLSKEGNLREYNLIGVLMGLAVYNSIILDLHFPSVCYRKLLTPPVVPAGDSVPVGIVPNPTLENLAEIMPDVAASLQDVMDYKGNIEEDLMLTFQASVEEYGAVITSDLKPGGKNEAVTNDNKGEFLKLYLNWLLNTTINERFRAFYLGFHSVCASNALIMLRPEEVEQLVCGCQTFDLAELKKVTYYDGYKQDDDTIKHFWEVLEDYSAELQKKFLLFTTGSDRVPVGGTGDMSIKITRLKDKLHHLPIAHTCFNQIGLPDYKDKDRLQRKLTIAISNAEGFGLE